MPEKPPLWVCPKCGQSFVGRNMAHSCATQTVEQYFAGRDPRLFVLYREYLALVERTCGPVTVNVNKTRISFQTRARFGGVTRVTRTYLVANFWLKRRLESPRFTRVEFIAPSNYIYTLRLASADDLDDEFAGWLGEACRVGNQDASVRPTRSRASQGHR